MKYKPLNLKYKDDIKWPKLPEEIPPNHGTPFFSNLTLGTRGQGKTHSVLEMMSNIIPLNFYNVFYCVSPTRQGDPKQKAFFNNLEEKYDVHYFEEFDEKTLTEIKESIEQNILLHRQYIKIKNVVDKFKKRGEKSLTEEELLMLAPYLEEDYLGDIDDIYDEFPDYIKRDIPPCSYIFIDDCYGSRLLTKTTGYNPLTWLIIRHRHLYTSISLLVQGLQNIPRAIRSNCILWIVFQQRARCDLKILYQENANVFDSEEEFKMIMDKLREKEHSFLYMDTSSTMKPDIRIGFNEPLL